MDSVTIDHKRMEAAGLPPPIPGVYSRLKGVETTAAMLSKDQLVNVRANMVKNLPMMTEQAEFNKLKGKDKPIALVGGGPSLREHLDELRTFRTILSCGSVHDYLISNDIIPTYAANCDPDAMCKRYFMKPHPEVRYYISSNSHPDLVDHLKDYQISLWHCHSDEQKEELIAIEAARGKVYNAVGGGCTIGLRAISIAMTIGYNNIHFFGFDSCMGDTEGKIHHAYDWSDPSEESLIDKVYKIKLGPESGPTTKEYYVAGYQLAQLENYKQFYNSHRMYFKPTFHGEGALSQFHSMLEADIDEQLSKGAI